MIAAHQPVPELSMVVVTYNRRTLLDHCLQSFLQADSDGVNWELIVVDNNSNDDTRAVAESYQDRLPLRYILESRQGVSIARNAGWEAAHGEWVGFVDDDAKIDPTYLRRAAALLQVNNFDVLGGPYQAYFSEPKRPWFKDAYQSNNARSGQVTLGPAEFLTGTSLIIRRRLLEAVGGFNVATGPTGKKRICGEDTEVQIRLRQAFPDLAIIWDSNLMVYHYCPIGKQSLHFAWREAIANGRGLAQIHALCGISTASWNSWVRLPAHLLILLLNVTLGWLVRDRARYPYWQQYVFEAIRRRMEGVSYHLQNLCLILRLA